MSTAANTLRTLHRIHQQLGDLRERQDRGPKQVQAHRNNVAKLDQETHQAHDAVKQAKIAADEKQLQLKTGEAKIADLRRKLNEAQSNREYQALLVQIAADEMAKSVLEDEILEALGKIDELQAATIESEKRHARSKEELGKVEATVREQAALIQGDVTRLEGELRTAESELPGEFRDIYQRVVKSKGSEGMAKVENDCCGGCFQQVQPNRISQLVMEHAVLCTSCGRLLYLPEDRSTGRKSS
jgi:predicted  nucleic acid-binding Zn-ribbon protein